MSENSEINEPMDESELAGSLPDEQAPLPSRSGDRISGETPIPQEILEKLAPEQQEMLLAAMFRSTEIQLPGSPFSQFLSKIEPQHITEMIAERSSRFALISADRKHSRLFNFLSFAFLVIASLTLMLVLALINENDLLLEIVKLGGVGLGGFGGGYGFSALRRRN